MAYTFKHGDRPLDDYTIQRAVGAGGFGEVYYAVSDGGREVALKYLRENPQVELRGVGHCINLKSPHLVSIFDVKKNAQGDYFIIMEYCSGPSLRDVLIAEPNGFPPQKAAFFLREIAKGLAYLHDRGIVHRDLKPGNIFYDDGYVKIGDYGLSKFIALSRHSAQTASVGTVHYMAPEIGSGNYSRGVDIYALGVILYEMLLGRVPFEGSSMGEVLMKHLTAQPAIDQLPHPFGQVIRRALQKDPKDRYQTVNEMVDELLEVEDVQKSLAGFSPQSLDGAVRRGAADRAASPMPSPNPSPTPISNWRADAGRRYRAAREPGAEGLVLSERIVKNLDRVARKMERKMAKLGGGKVTPPPIPKPGPRPNYVAGTPSTPAVVLRKRRKMLLGVLCLGLTVGLGVLVGATMEQKETGVATAMMAMGMFGGILLSRKAVGWFGTDDGPKWSRQLVRVCCCAPLIFIGGAPLIDSRRGEEGLAVALGLLLVTLFSDWDRLRRRQSGGELCFGAAFKTAIFALMMSAIPMAIQEADPGYVLVAAGIAGIVSLMVQATAWWSGQPDSGATPVAYPVAAAPFAPADHAGAPPTEARSPTPPYSWPPPPPATPAGQWTDITTQLPALRRWGVARGFWGLVSFALAGGAIVTFLVPLILTGLDRDDITASIIGCVACTSAMIFALRKTTAIRRFGFWRETLRPFLMSAALFGVGATITGIATQWSDCHSDEQVMLIVGLVFSSLLLIVTTLARGRKGRPMPSFLQGSASPPAPPVASPPVAPAAPGLMQDSAV